MINLISLLILMLKKAILDKDSFYNEKISQAKGILKPFILRRIKTEVQRYIF
jgi:hypothetical protein